MIEYIDKLAFSDSKLPILFDDGNFAWSYGILSGYGNSFRLSWSSESIKPTLLEIRDGIISIGVNQHFAVVNLISNEVILNLKLFYFLYDIKAYKDYIFIATEYEIIKIDNSNFAILSEYPLNEIYTSMEFVDDRIIVNCLDGSVEYKNIK